MPDYTDRIDAAEPARYRDLRAAREANSMPPGSVCSVLGCHEPATAIVAPNVHYCERHARSDINRPYRW